MSTYSPTKISDDTMERLFRSIEYIIDESYEREFPGQLLKAFFYVASRDGCLQKELENQGFSSSSASRNLNWLSQQHRLGKEGLHWIEIKNDRSNHKLNRVFLTPLGHKVIKQMKYQLTTKRIPISLE